MVPEGELGQNSDLPSSDQSGHGQVHARDSHGDVYETLDEEEVVEGMVVKLVKRFDEETAKKEVAKVRIFAKEICGSISAEQQGKRESVDSRAEGERVGAPSELNMKRRTSRRRST